MKGPQTNATSWLAPSDFLSYLSYTVRPTCIRMVPTAVGWFLLQQLEVKGMTHRPICWRQYLNLGFFFSSSVSSWQPRKAISPGETLRCSHLFIGAGDRFSSQALAQNDSPSPWNLCPQGRRKSQVGGLFQGLAYTGPASRREKIQFLEFLTPVWLNEPWLFE